jgi:hypothetical protein
MYIRLIQPDLFFGVAGITDLIFFFFQEELGEQSVTEVAFFTLFFLDDSMHVLHGEVFIRKLLVTVKALFTLKLLPLRLGG